MNGALRAIAPLFREAAGVLAGNRTRSALTIVGLVIGVAAVIAIQILGHGMSSAVTGILGGLSDNSFFLFPSRRQADFAKAAFTASDIARARASVPGLAAAIPAGNVSRLVSNGHVRARLSVSDDADVSFASIPLIYGRTISHDDVANAANVAVLSNAAYTKLFPSGGDPTGATLRVADRRYLVVGAKGPPTQGIVPVNFDGDVDVPYTTFVRNYLQNRPVVAARFIVTDAARIADVEDGVKVFFRGIKQQRADYQTFDRRTFSTTIDGIFAVLTIVVALVGAVSLLVAGIGIMNIMLVSVSERTREIGVRKAIGATRLQILAQFFVEALLLSLVGCGLGLLLGLAVGAAVDRFVLVAISGVVPRIPWLQSVAIAVGFASLVTLVFGTYPAYRAARLDPIEALRYE